MVGSEIVLGLITTVGTDTENVIRYMKEHLNKFLYNVEVINVSSEILSTFSEGNGELNFTTEYDRIKYFMDLGNDVRERTNDASIIMKGVVAYILSQRDSVDNPSPRERTAYIIKSIKHPDEADYLKQVYGDGFHLIGITSNICNRKNYLTNVKNMESSQALELMTRDSDEINDLGQHTQDAFQNSDYFINVGANTNDIQNSVFRLIDLLFGNPFITPTFEEYAMFMAYAASMRSADLSRQIGAVITRDNEILSSGVNDCPRYKGGLYWQIHDQNCYYDEKNGRDYMLGFDSNKKEQNEIIDKILLNLGVENTPDNKKRIKRSGIGALTEYGRVVHAEMEAILSCARNSISSKDATMYATTFPCHNCAKHIIAAGIKKVVYIEPYPKSKAIKFYKREISTELEDVGEKVVFIPFSGVGPRRYIDLFAMTSSKWGQKIRKDEDGNKVEWDRTKAKIRNPMNPLSYLDYEKVAYLSYYDEIKGEDNNG
ncbi:anti-phage dCTP deaminase [Ruminococcus difficilis]|uniref:CMP/dCMP-type deaminase domain-containing protein n=1 Tax=Ruminococcus difficilis TaxID=2763069 RepID=A0A934U3A8_9FIRM|nr:anti-phage dCTP deaminase [Ruminococcus difficilis]MBK6087624.1 hypothetical protein [Ruminococcus difficilis]